MSETHTAHEMVDWQHYMTHQEVDMMQALACELPLDAVIVKVGAGAGTDTITILEATQDVVIFSIDILAGEEPATTNEHLRLIENGYDKSGCVIRVWGDSKVVGLRWPLLVDWIHIDGDHSPDGITNDIKAWFRHLRPGGFISFHDYDDPKWPAVKPTVDKYMQGHEFLPKYSADKFAVYRKRE
jgi:SAM-dependent methyltransferase